MDSSSLGEIATLRKAMLGDVDREYLKELAKRKNVKITLKEQEFVNYITAALGELYSLYIFKKIQGELQTINDNIKQMTGGNDKRMNTLLFITVYKRYKQNIQEKYTELATTHLKLSEQAKKRGQRRTTLLNVSTKKDTK